MNKINSFELFPLKMPYRIYMLLCMLIPIIFLLFFAFTYKFASETNRIVFCLMGLILSMLFIALFFICDSIYIRKDKKIIFKSLVSHRAIDLSNHNFNVKLYKVAILSRVFGLFFMKINNISSLFFFPVFRGRKGWGFLGDYNIGTIHHEIEMKIKTVLRSISPHSA